MSRFSIGDKVRKVVGYPFTGKVVAVYPDEEKCSVRHADGWDHIFHDKQLAFDSPEYQYLDLLRDCLENGVYREGRNGGTYGLFGRQIRFNLDDGLPVLTTKKLFTKAIIGELLWFLSGSTSVKPLQEQGITIWDEWADEDGELGPVYGKQWRSWLAARERTDGVFTFIETKEVDQIANLIQGLKKDPYGRRHIVTAWNPVEIPDMALPPCHCLFQFFVSDGKLSCQLYQRSADIFLGVPFNIASYALLVHLVAREVGLQVGDFVHTFGDVHLYANHVDQAREQLTRTPRPFPTLELTERVGLFDLETKDVGFVGYYPHAAIRAEVSV